MKGFGLKGGRKRILEEEAEENAVIQESILSFEAVPPAEKGAKEDEGEKLVIPLPPSLAQGRAVKNGDHEGSAGAEGMGAEVGDKDAETSAKPVPLLLQGLDPRLLSATGDHDRFKVDMSLRAEDVECREENYAAVPVEKFGAAMLRGMGWAGPTQADEDWAKSLDNFVPRDAMLGLGAVAKPPEGREKKWDKGKEKQGKWEEQAKLKLAMQKLAVGDAVWLRSKVYAGMRGRVVQTQGVPGLSRVRIALESTGGIVDMPKDDAVLIMVSELETRPLDTSKIDAAAAAAAKALVKVEEAANQAAKRRRMDDAATGITGSCNVSGSSGGNRSSCPTQSWCMPGIRVRGVSKKLGKGYLCKGYVVLVGEGVTVRLDGDGALMKNVKLRHLETIIPKAGGRVRVLVGPHRGRDGVVLRKDKPASQVGVRIDGAMGEIMFPMDDVSEIQ
jgi:hypothetical protein